MMNSKIVSIALAGLLTVGGACTTAFASDTTTDSEVTKPSVSIKFNKEDKSAALAEKGMSRGAGKMDKEDMGANRAEKSANLGSGVTRGENRGELKESKENRVSSRGENRGENRGSGVANREANVAARTEKGVTKSR